MTKDNRPKELVNNGQSPYFLHPFDSPGAIITTIKFNGKNYYLWEQATRTALKAKNKLGFIDRKISKPAVPERTNLAEAEALEMINSMITSWVMNVIDPKVHAPNTYSIMLMWWGRMSAKDTRYLTYPGSISLELKLHLVSKKDKMWLNSLLGSWVCGMSLINI